MDMFVVQGGTRLTGQVRVEGAKNAALPIMAACMTIAGPVRLQAVPQLVDIDTMSRLLRSLGASVEQLADQTCIVDATAAHGTLADYDLVRRMRASVCVLGPLLSRFGKACVSLPGGCNIGHRPIDLHLKGLAALGADIRIERGYVVAQAARLQGADIRLDGPCGSTVTGTCNVMAAAAVASGRTVIRMAAREPEVVDLARFLNSAGADIQGAGTATIEIRGVESLQPVTHRIISDRIEAATLAIAAATTRGDVTIQQAPVQLLTRVLETLQEINVQVQVSGDDLRIHTPAPLRPVDAVAEPYPGLPTDIQAQLMALLATIPGRSRITDRVFSDRFMHAAELIRMGANIRREADGAVIEGVPRLSAASVMASDLRASAALVLAALTTDGESHIRRIYHLDRGYQQLEQKLNLLGARILRCADRGDRALLPDLVRCDPPAAQLHNLQTPVAADLPAQADSSADHSRIQREAS